MGRGSMAEEGPPDALDNSAITVFEAFLCGYAGCVQGKECFGCMGSETCLCCECEGCLKSGVEPLCLYCCAIRQVPITVLCKSQSQVCCLASASALPCDEEVPPIVACCAFACYPQTGCCKTMGELTGKTEGLTEMT